MADKTYKLSLPDGSGSWEDVDLKLVDNGDDTYSVAVEGSISIDPGDIKIGSVDVDSIAAGTNLIGKVSIDQVTANANEVVKKPVTPTVYNTTLTNADTEYSQALASAKGIEFQARTSVDIRFAFVTGKVATPTAPYMTLKAGQWYYFDGTPGTLYLASSTAGTIVEIILWS